MPIENVLVVDDDPDLRRIAQMSLKKVGKWNVLLAGSGREALSVASLHALDVILLDVMMPEMDGPTTLANLRSGHSTRSIPVIFLSAKVQPHEVDDYLALGACGVIFKPFDPMRLSSDVERLVQCKA